VAQAIVSGGGDAHPFVCDVCDESQVVAAFDAVEETMGAVDIVVNNAGNMMLKPRLKSGRASSPSTSPALSSLRVRRCGG